MKPILTEMRNNKTFKAWVQGNPEVVEEGMNESEAIARLLLRLQGVRVRTWNGSLSLAVGAWLSVFVESWLLLTGPIESGGMAWSLWGFFLLVAVLSSSMAMRK